MDTLEPLPSFLIVCEGEKTEPLYFGGFRVYKEFIRLQIFGEGCNTLSLIEKTLERAKGREFDQVWCVLDRDSFPPNHFNDALRLAEAKGVRVAYSNEAFELWYILHFDFIEGATPRTQYREMLDARLPAPYRKNSETLYRELLPRQQTAIRNAKKLLANYSPHNPEVDNPCTTVFLLVEELNSHIG